MEEITNKEIEEVEKVLEGLSLDINKTVKWFREIKKERRAKGDVFIKKEGE